jgi:hypothetical protein
VQNTAAANVPATLARRTIAHMRHSRSTFAAVSSAITGSTTVMVFSVNSCWRASTTMTKPTE